MTIDHKKQARYHAARQALLTLQGELARELQVLDEIEAGEMQGNLPLSNLGVAAVRAAQASLIVRCFYDMEQTL
jgi:flagellar biosynthesis/type III secretory pathway M-ring protein FliF/YscJ